MEAIQLQDAVISIGMSLCVGDRAANLGSLRELGYESTPNAPVPARKARLAPRMPSGFRKSSKNLISSFTKSLPKSNNANPRVRRKSVDGCSEEERTARSVADELFSQSVADELRAQESGDPERTAVTAEAPAPERKPYPRRNSVAGPISPGQVAQLVAGEYFAIHRPDPEPVPAAISPLEDEAKEEAIDASGQDNVGSVKTFSGSGHSKLSSEVSLAMEVGQTAHDYLEECFYTEVTVLDRKKFNAVPEIVKSDLTIARHLGKGSFSDVFEVVCNESQLGAKMKLDNNVSQSVSGTAIAPPQPPPRRHGRARRSTVSESINLGSLSRPPPCDKRKLVLAMKCLRPQVRADAEKFIIGAEDLVHETAILANLNHRHIIKLHGRASGNLTDAFVLNDGYFILIDRLALTLNDRLGEWKMSPKLSLLGPTAKQIEIAQSVADALSYLHSKKIAFRDLKPDNVGFDSQGVVKLFDFGFAIGLPEKDESNPTGLLYDRCGTPRFMAPEVALSLGYGLPADVYSFGMLLWQTCSLVKPFSSITTASQFEREVYVRGVRPEIKGHWPKALKNLIGGCWSASPFRRPSILQVKSALSLVMAEITNEKPMRNVRRMVRGRRRSDAENPGYLRELLGR